MTRSFMLLKFKHNNTMKKATIIKSVLAAFAFFASAALVSCEKEVNTTEPEPDVKNPAAVIFGYYNEETQDMLEYCNIVMEYTDVNGTKVDTITATEWTKIFTTQLPCTYTFKKTYTLKADKNMASAEKIEYKRNSYGYVYKLLSANGDSIGDAKEISHLNKPNFGTASKVAESISTGYFNTVHEFVYDSDGKLKLDGKESE